MAITITDDADEAEANAKHSQKTLEAIGACLIAIDITDLSKAELKIARILQTQGVLTERMGMFVSK